MPETENLAEEPKPEPVRDRIIAIGLLIVSIIYAILPSDLVPDLPVIGWLDDVFVVLIASLHAIQKTVAKNNDTLVKLLKYAKYILFALAIIALMMMLLFGAFFINLIQS